MSGDSSQPTVSSWAVLGRQPVHLFDDQPVAHVYTYIEALSDGGITAHRLVDPTNTAWPTAEFWSYMTSEGKEHEWSLPSTFNLENLQGDANLTDFTQWLSEDASRPPKVAEALQAHLLSSVMLSSDLPAQVKHENDPIGLRLQCDLCTAAIDSCRAAMLVNQDTQVSTQTTSKENSTLVKVLKQLDENFTIMREEMERKLADRQSADRS